MTITVLREVVTLGGLALQAEDCLIRAAVGQRHLTGGLARLENERHHQFIVWRSILPLWPAELERDGASDLIVRCQDGSHFFEMKNWRGSSGASQLPAMRKDVEKLRTREKGYLLVTSMNPPSVTEGNFTYLTHNVSGLQVDAGEVFRFLTEGTDGSVLEFWIAGWPLRQGLQI